MIAAYFPFTYVSKLNVQKIASIFGKFFVYQPVDNLTPISIDNNLIEIRNPMISCKKEINAVLNDSFSWINMNFKNIKIDIDLMRNFSKIIPFYDKDSISSIKENIKNINTDGKNSKNILFRACLFLALAEYNDLYNDELDLELNNFKSREKVLSLILEGRSVEENIDIIRENLNQKKDFSVFMCAERIKSWAALVLEDNILPDFLITDNSFILDELASFNLGVDIFKISKISIPYPKEKDINNYYLIKYIKSLLKDNISVANFSFLKNTVDCLKKDNKISLNFYVLKDLSMQAFLLKINPNTLKHNSLDKLKLNSNTVIVSII